MNYTIFFTNQCNMDCTYCYECNKMVRSTSYDVLDGIVNFIVEKQRSCSDKTVSIVTHGGEPLIEFDKIQYFIKRLNEKVKNVQYIITTNATLLTDLMIDFLSQKHNKLETDYAKANIKGGYTIALNHSVLNFINAVTIAVLLGYGGYKVIIGSLSYGGLVTFNLYSQRFIAPILQLVQFNNDLTTCNIAWNRLNNLLNTKIDVKNGTQTKTIQGNIKFEDVTFYYEEKKPVLHDVFMEFKKGEIYAIVGQSGAGKTTLMHLLFRLWDCISGSITVDGIDIKDFDIDCLRGQISIVSQNIFLLNDTIYNNIVLGKEITDEELQHILVQAGLHEFINTLPNKLETVVGENGIKLSGGEKQRISIARALLKKNPILIFDEATSMLDNETEEKIISILLDSFKDTTIILIAHRLSTVKNANTIYVLNNGTIMEHGNHDQLLEQKGIYYHLYNI